MDESSFQEIVNFLTKGIFPNHLVNGSKADRQNFKRRASTFKLDKDSHLYKVVLSHKFVKLSIVTQVLSETIVIL